MAELRELLAAVRIVQRRSLLNAFLKEWTWWVTAVLGGLLLAALLSPSLAGAVAAAVVLLCAGMLASVWYVLRKRPTVYEAAARLDRAAGLKDRLSTALFLSSVEKPRSVVRAQREDALARLAEVDARAAIPIHAPAGVRRLLVLLVLAGGLFAYRMQFDPPVLALFRGAADTRVAQVMLTPIAHAMEKQAQKESGARLPADSPRDQAARLPSPGPEQSGAEGFESGSGTGSTARFPTVPPGPSSGRASPTASQ